MRLVLTCPKCPFAGAGEKTTNKPVVVDQRDDGLYDVQCDAGHQSRARLQNQKFEILFEMGAMALLDGYWREAVANFAASLERFFEFYALVAWLEAGISPDEISRAWKPFANASERQIGAYVASYLLRNRVAPSPFILDAKPPGYNESWSAFRNAVVHKGAFVSREQAIAYGNLVYEFIWKELDELRAKSHPAFIRAVAVGATKTSPNEVGVTTVLINTLINTVGGDRASDLQTALQRLTMHRWWHWTNKNP